MQGWGRQGGGEEKKTDGAPPPLTRAEMAQHGLQCQLNNVRYARSLSMYASLFFACFCFVFKCLSLPLTSVSPSVHRVRETDTLLPRDSAQGGNVCKPSRGPVPPDQHSHFHHFERVIRRAHSCASGFLAAMFRTGNVWKQLVCPHCPPRALLLLPGHHALDNGLSPPPGQAPWTEPLTGAFAPPRCFIQHLLCAVGWV